MKIFLQLSTFLIIVASVFAFSVPYAAAQPSVARTTQDDSLMDEVMGVTNPVLGLPYKVPVLAEVTRTVMWPVKKTTGLVLSPFQHATEWIAQDDASEQIKQEQQKIVADASQEAARQRILDAQPIEKVTP